MNTNKTERQVAAIKNGTVIDHIPAEKTYEVANLLELQKLENPVTIGYNYPSKKIGKKGIIKVSDKFFTDEEISRLSVVAPKWCSTSSRTTRWWRRRQWKLRTSFVASYVATTLSA